MIDPRHQKPLPLPQHPKSDPPHQLTPHEKNSSPDILSSISSISQESIARLVDTMSVNEMVNMMGRVLAIGAKLGDNGKGYSRSSSDREKYASLLDWHHTCLAGIQKQLKQSQITLYNAIQQQHGTLLTAMHQFAAQLERQCEQKGLLARVLTLHHFNLYESLAQFMDKRFKNCLSERIEAQSKIYNEYEQQLHQLRTEMQNLKEGKDKKWKNLFMLIKDNRVLRRTKGKLMRELQAAMFRQQQLKENVIELTKESQRYKLLGCSTQYERDGMQKWLKNLSSLIKIEKYIQKQPGKAKRVLQYELQNLQINEMQALPDKIQYVIKAIQEAEELVDYYQDFNDFITPCKLLLNNYTQTQLQQQQTGMNTITTKYTNAYCTAKSSHMLENRLVCVSQVYGLYFGDERWPKRGGLRKESSISSSSKGGERGWGTSSGHGHLGVGKSGFLGMPYLRVVKAVEETIVPTFIPISTPKKDGSEAYKYVDSKFLQKLNFYDKEINLIISGGTVLTTSRSKQKSIQKRYSDISSISCQQFLPTYRSTTQNNPNPNPSSTETPQLAEQYRYHQLSPRFKLNKRYSYNSRLLPIQNRYKRISDIEGRDPNNSEDNFTMLGGDGESQVQSMSVVQENLAVVNPGTTRENDVISEEHSSVSSISQKVKKSDKEETAIEGPKLKRIKEKIGNLTRNSTVGLLTNRKISSRVQTQPSNLSSFAKSSQKGRSSQRPIQTASSSVHNPIALTKVSSKLSKRGSITAAQSSSTQRNSHRLPQPGSPFKQSQSSHNYTINIKSSDSDYNFDSDRYSEDSSCVNGPTMKTRVLNSIDQNKMGGGPATNNRRGQVYGNFPMTENRNSNFSVNNVRGSYQVAPILQEDVLDDNGAQQDEKATQMKKEKSSTNQIQTAKHILSTYFEPQSDTTQIDPQKVCQKILHLLFINKHQLRHSPRTLKQYIETNLKNMFGLTPHSQYTSFNKSLALENQPSCLALSFIRMLNYHTPTAYQIDIFRVYLILLEKCGTEALICEMEKAMKIVEYVTGIFYYEGDVGEVTREIKSNLTILSLNNMSKSGKNKNKKSNNMSTLTNLHVNMNQYFLILQSDLRIKCLQTQIYQFCQQILPQNETDLNFQQFCQILKFLPYNTELHIHISRLRLYMQRDKPRANNSIKIAGMKFHKISLYCSREKWISIRDISNKIEKDFKACMQQNFYIEEVIELYNKLQRGQFGQCLTKTSCPWLYGLAKNQAEKYKDYGSKVSKNLFMLIWLIETNLRINSFGLMWNNLEILAEKTRKLMEKRQINRSINGVKLEQPQCLTIQRQKQRQKSYKKELNIQGGGSNSQGLVKSNKNMNN